MSAIGIKIHYDLDYCGTNTQVDEFAKITIGISKVTKITFKVMTKNLLMMYSDATSIWILKIR